MKGGYSKTANPPELRRLFGLLLSNHQDMIGSTMQQGAGSGQFISSLPRTYLGFPSAQLRLFFTLDTDMAKEPVEQVVIADEGAELQVATKWQGTEADRHDMRVIGRPQQLRRNFQLSTILGFGCTLISTWEINITYSPPASLGTVLASTANHVIVAAPLVCRSRIAGRLV